MKNTVSESGGWIEWQCLKEVKKTKSKIKWYLRAALLASWVVPLSVDAIRKYKDTDKYWEVKELKTDNEQHFLFNEEEVTIDDIIEHNPDLKLIPNIPYSISESESDLKTTWFFHNVDALLEDLWVERSKHSSSLIWRLLSVLSTGSYWPYQTQREAIDNYKIDDDTYNELCEQVAKLNLPNKEWQWLPMYQILWFNTVEDMVNVIKNHRFDIYSWGWRFWIDYGLVLQNKIYEDALESFESIDPNLYENDYQKALAKLETTDKEIQKYNSKAPSEVNDLMTIYCIKVGDKTTDITYRYIKDKLTSDEFLAGLTSALWCTNPVETKIVSKYHYLLNIMELNVQFSGAMEDKWTVLDFNLDYQVWNFWPACTKLVNKLFDQQFDPETQALQAKKYLMNYVASNWWYDELIKKELNQYLWNMRRFYALNAGHVENGLHEWIDANQIKFLEENLKASFNNTYIAVEIFKNYLIDMWLSDKVADVDELRNNFVVNHKKGDLKTLFDIMLNESAFNEFTGLGSKNDKWYKYFIKYKIWKWLLITTIVTWNTWEIVPVQQEKASRTKNEVNTIYRFEKWVSTTKGYLWDLAMWIPYRFDRITLNESGENPIYAELRRWLREKSDTRTFLQEHCRTENFWKIESMDDIPNEIIQNITVDASWNKILMWDSLMLLPDVVYFKYNESDGDIFSVLYDDLVLPKDSNFIVELFNLVQDDAELRAVIEKIEWHEIIEKTNITSRSIVKLIRDSKWRKFKNVNNVFAWTHYQVWIPLVDVSSIHDSK